MKKWVVGTYLIIIAYLVLTSYVVNGSGQMMSELRNYENFSSVFVIGKGTLFVTQGDNPYVRIQAEDNIVSLIETWVKDDILYIRTPDFLVYPRKPLNYYVVLPEIHKLGATGDTKIIGQNQINGDTLFLLAAGTSTLDLDVNCEHLFTSLSGWSEAKLTGRVRNHDLLVSGLSKFYGSDMYSWDTRVSLSGATEATIYVTKNVYGQLSGDSFLYYRGKAKVHIDTSGISKYKRTDGLNVTD